MRKITTVEELDALPSLAVILLGLDDKSIPGALAAQKDELWYIPSNDYGATGAQVAQAYAPHSTNGEFTAYVVYEGVTPEEELLAQKIMDGAHGLG